MQSEIIYRNRPPGLWPLYGRALTHKHGADATIPELSAQLTGVRTDDDRLRRYRSICGFANQRTLPMTWIHILAFPLHLRLLTDSVFPLPLLGLVHLRNQITQWRPIATGECLDIRVALSDQTRTGKGLEFDLVTTAHSAGRCVWEERSTNLYRQPQKHSAARSGPPPELPYYPHLYPIQADESIGREYGRVSGDLNPIHMHKLSARAFGFPRAIAHGMWSKARCIAQLEQQPGWTTTPVTVACQFKKPFFLPGTAQLNWKGTGKEWPFQLLNASGDAPHLSGEVRWE